MASENLTKARALPRAQAKAFCNDKYMTVMTAGIIFAFVMSVMSVIQGYVTGSDIVVLIPETITTAMLLYLALRFSKLKQVQDEKIAKQASTASMVYALVLIFSIILIGSFYMSVVGMIESGDFTDVPQENLDAWMAGIPFYVFSLVLMGMQAISFFLMKRAMRDVAELCRGRYPDRNAFTAVSVFMSLTAGCVLCGIALNVMMYQGDIMSIVLSVFTAVPDFLIYFGGSQLCRRASLRKNGINN